MKAADDDAAAVALLDPTQVRVYLLEHLAGHHLGAGPLNRFIDAGWGLGTSHPCPLRRRSNLARWGAPVLDDDCSGDNRSKYRFNPIGIRITPGDTLTSLLRLADLVLKMDESRRETELGVLSNARRERNS